MIRVTFFLCHIPYEVAVISYRVPSHVNGFIFIKHPFNRIQVKACSKISTPNYMNTKIHCVPSAENSADKMSASMKYGLEIHHPGGSRKIRTLACSLALMPLVVLAQNSSETEDKDTIFELSPFAVKGGNVGYRATSTLAGSRINTDLKDLGAAITVVTAEFLEDTASTNVQDLFANLPGLEIGGPQGNFSAADLSGQWGGFDTDAYDLNPQSSARVRGLERPNFTRGYFSTQIPVDSYNTGTITVSRGANSLLFGLGSAGGVVDAGLNAAIIGQDESKFGFTFDDHGTARGTLSLGRTLIEDRLAVRLDVLNGDTKYQQDPAHEKSERFFGAINAVLAKNENSEFFGKTSLKANFEIGEMSSTPSSPLLPSSGIRPFFEAPTTDYKLYTGSQSGALGESFERQAARWEPWSVFDGRPYEDMSANNGYFNGNGPSRARNDDYFKGNGHFFIFERPTLSYVDGNASLRDGSHGTTGRLAHRNVIGVNGNTYAIRPFIQLSSAWWGKAQPNFNTESLTDRNIFDYRNYLISGDTKRIEREFDTHSITFEQILFNGKGGLELTYAKENFDRESQLPFSGSGQFSAEQSLAIDLSEYLPSGELNPHVGKAFLHDRTNETTEFSEERDNLRATVFYEHDFSDRMDGKLGKIFGRHRLTGLFQEEDKTSESRKRALFLGSDATDSGYASEEYLYFWGNEPNPISRFNSPTYKIYLSDDLRGKNLADVRLRPAQFNMPQEGDVHSFEILDTSVPIVDGNWQGAYRNAQWRYNSYFNGGDISRRRVTSDAVAWQSYLLDGHIVGLAGWRTDKIDSWSRITDKPRTPEGGVDIEEWNQLQEEETRRKGSTSTWSLVAHMPERFVENLPVSSVSFHIGEGENFSAVSQRNDIYNNVIDNPSGLTEEFGITLGFADERWRLKLNRFETSSSYANVGGISNQVVNIFAREIPNRFRNNYVLEAPDDIVFEDQPIAQAGYGSFEEFELALVDAVLEPVKSAFNYHFDPEEGRYVSGGRIENLSDTQSVVSKGYELELVGNPTDNWRVMANVTKVEAVTSDSILPTARFFEEQMAVYRERGFVDLPITVVSNDGSSDNDTTFGEFVRGLASDINEIQAKDGNLNQELREWRVNLVTSYDFNEGRIKGFGVGGALRYQSEAANGYTYTLGDDRVMTPNVSDPFMGDSLVNGDIWFSYKKKLANKVDWKIQLNIRNAIGSQDNVVVYTNPDGMDAVFRNAPERVWSLRNTFSF